MSANAPICQHFLRGKCKYGKRCRNRHPAPDSASDISSLNSPSPRQQNAAPGSLPDPKSAAVRTRMETILKDMGPERPYWPFSGYGMSGLPNVIKDIDQSTEEVHFMFLFYPKDRALAMMQDLNQRTKAQYKKIKDNAQSVAQLFELQDQVKRDAQPKPTAAFDQYRTGFQNTSSPSANPRFGQQAAPNTFGQPAMISHHQQQHQFFGPNNSVPQHQFNSPPNAFNPSSDYRPTAQFSAPSQFNANQHHRSEQFTTRQPPQNFMTAAPSSFAQETSTDICMDDSCSTVDNSFNMRQQQGPVKNEPPSGLAQPIPKHEPSSAYAISCATGSHASSASRHDLDLAAFEANFFQLGSVPIHPPPAHLC